MMEDKYSRELDVAVRAVHLACWLCQRAQQKLLTTNGDHVKSKDDDSPVTVAGYHFSISGCIGFLSIL